MNIGFLLWWQGDTTSYVLADQLVRSAHRVMPGVPVVQLADGGSPAFDGVDEVRRLDWNGPFALWCAEHYAKLEGDWLLVDTDCELRRDVRGVFDQSFDVALTDRAGLITDAQGASPWYQKNPWNIGVVFSRSPEFWRRVAARVRTYPAERQQWMGNQEAVGELMREPGVLADLKVIELPGSTYNYPPRSAAEDLTERAIVHYKGPRKDWLIERLRQDAEPPRVATPVADRGIPLRVFIGYDPRQPVAFHVAAHSIATRSTVPVAITRLQLNQLPLRRRGLTEFTYSRFLVPWLCGFAGRAIFVDADVLCRSDIVDLDRRARDTGAAVSVVEHAQLGFERASVMAFDCAKCGVLTPAYVADPLNKLFDLAWAPSVGALPASWNRLIGYDAPDPMAQLLHFTQGVPCWEETAGQDGADEWRAALAALQATVGFAELMGQSVHPLAQRVAVVR